MTIEEKLDHIDFVLITYEDIAHGVNGDLCSQARKYIEELKFKLKQLNDEMVN
jgi:hypothetical protein